MGVKNSKVKSTEKNPLCEVITDHESDDPVFKRYWERIRQSSNLVLVVVFVGYMMDSLVTSTTLPLFPAIVKYAVSGDNPKCNASVENMEINDECKVEYKDYAFMIGVLIGAKPASETLASVVIGIIIEKFGHRTPLLIGCLFNAIGCVGFAFASNFWILLTTRIIQGVSSGLTIIGSGVFLAVTFEGPEELSKAVGITTLAFGVGGVLGWPFGAYTYELLGRPAPFVILACISMLDGLLRLISVSPSTQTKQNREKGSDTCGFCLRKVFSDIHIIVCLFNMFFFRFFISLFVSFETPMVLDRLDGEIWQLATIVFIALIFQVILQIFGSNFAVRIGLWRLTIMGYICCGVSYILFTFVTYIWQVLGTELLHRAGFAFLVVSVFVQYKLTMDEKKIITLGRGMALMSFSYNLGKMTGPFFGALVLSYID